MSMKARLDAQTAEETFDDFTAIGMAEGFIECKTEEDSLRAWQHLVDSGLCYLLQGRFGRQAEDMIQKGLLTRPVNNSMATSNK